MFCLKSAMLNIRRHKSKSILVTLTCMLIVVFVFIYMDGIETNQKQLLSLPQAIPVTAQIRNLNASQEIGLQIREDLVDKIQSSGYVKDLHYTTRLSADASSASDTKKALPTVSILGVNDIQSVPDLQDRQIHLADGADTDFLRGKDALCLAGESFLQQHNLSIGDTVDLTFYRYKYIDPSTSVYRFQPLGKSTLRIAGSISAPLYAADPVNIDILCPAGWVKELHVQAGEDFFLDSCNFTVADPLNLDTFKATMQRYYILPINSLCQFSIWGNALRVKDEIFISTAGRLKSNLSVLYSFAPAVFIVIALVGYALAYLLMQSRRADIAIMRSLGTSRKACVMMMLIEYAALGLTGCLLGIACAAIWIVLAWSTLLYAMLFFFSLMLGVLAAAFQISRINTMTGLIKTES